MDYIVIKKFKNKLTALRDLMSLTALMRLEF